MTAWNTFGIAIDGRTVYSLTNNDGLQVARHNNPQQRAVYQASVAATLEIIQRRRAGQILLDEIRRASHANRHQIRIVPFTSDNAASGGDGINQAPYGEIVRDRHGNPMTHLSDDPATPQIEHLGEVMRGTGQGIDPLLLFDPRTFTSHLSLIAGLSADETVFHELVHSKRQMQSKNVFFRMGGEYDNSEEFRAIVATNIYSSESGAIWLRGNHRRPQPFLNPATTIVDLPADGEMGVPGQNSAAQQFARTYHRELNEFARNDSQFTRRLADIRAHFNPIREHLLNIGAIPRS